MLIKGTITTTLALAATALAACGASGGAGPTVTPGAAKAHVERAADIELRAESVPADARRQGLRASYSNAATAVHDRQVVGLFVMDDPNVAERATDMVRGSAPRSAKLMVNGNVMVVYADAGSNHAGEIQRAVKAL